MVSAAENETRLDEHRAFVDAAADAGVEHVVYVSFFGAAPDATFTLARDHFATEEHIKASGMAWTFLRDNLYLEFTEAMVGMLVAASPFAENSVANGGSSALFAASSNSPSPVSAISSTRVVPPVLMICLMAFAVGALRSITLSVLLPSPAYSSAVRYHAVRARMVVVDCGVSCVEHDADKPPDGPLEREVS